jgi:hypothetical protein
MGELQTLAPQPHVEADEIPPGQRFDAEDTVFYPISHLLAEPAATVVYRPRRGRRRLDDAAVLRKLISRLAAWLQRQRANGGMKKRPKYPYPTLVEFVQKSAQARGHTIARRRALELVVLKIWPRPGEGGAGICSGLARLAAMESHSQ